MRLPSLLEIDQVGMRGKVGGRDLPTEGQMRPDQEMPFRGRIGQGVLAPEKDREFGPGGWMSIEGEWGLPARLE